MPSASPPARVVLVEDDAAIRKFAALALDGMAIELVSCSGVAEAIAALRAAPAQLLITDLMMPGESGLGLLARLAAEPALRGTARIVVFSAGLRDGVPRQLAAYDVWRLLHKPVSIATLERCVREALQFDPMAAPGASLPPGEEAAVIERNFAGNAALFTQFRASVLQQLPLDIAAAERACADHDAPALRRIAHNLGSVLRLLGHDDAAARAAAVEQAALAEDLALSVSRWHGLLSSLQQLS